MTTEEIKNRPRFVKERSEEVAEWITITGIDVPRFLAVESTIIARLSLNPQARDYFATELPQSLLENSGYEARVRLIQHGCYVYGSGTDFSQAFAVPDYQTVRECFEQLGVNPAETATLGSRLLVRITEKMQPGWLDADEVATEEVFLVSKLDNLARDHWVSVETEMGKSLLGHKVGDTVEYFVKDKNRSPHPIVVSILQIN